MCWFTWLLQLSIICFSSWPCVSGPYFIRSRSHCVHFFTHETGIDPKCTFCCFEMNFMPIWTYDKQCSTYYKSFKNSFLKIVCLEAKCIITNVQKSSLNHLTVLATAKGCVLNEFWSLKHINDYRLVKHRIQLVLWLE